MSLRDTVFSLLGGIVGGVIVWRCHATSLKPNEMSYADLAAVLLAAVGVIVAVFGSGLALVAIWGFKQLKRDAISAAETAGAIEIKEQIENGAIRDYIKGEIERLTDEEFKSDRMDKRINLRVDAVTFGRSDDDRLLEEDGGSE